MEPFQYEPLDLGTKSFRLLILYPGDDEIRCDIFQAVLELNDLVPYEALSYAWGGIDRTQSITANGKILPITERLFTALTHLRTQQARILWVDAICIDQDNFAERGHQVGQMAGIYRQAEQVLIWLGPGTADTALLMQTLQTLHHESIHRRSPSDVIEWARNRWEDLDLDESFSTQERHSFPRGLQHMFQHPWFTRVWVLQEVSYARMASICCGHFLVPAYIFVMATQFIKKQDSAIFELDDQRQTLLDLMPSPSGERITRKKSLHTLLQKFRGSEATDPRDLVYALLGIASDTPKGANNTPLVPDYFKTETGLIQDLELYLCCRDPLDQRILDTDLRTFIKTIPAMTDATFERFVVKGHLNGIIELLARGQSFKITQKTISALGSNAGIHSSSLRDPEETLCGLLRLEDSKLTFNPDAIAAAFDWCDDGVVPRVSIYCEERMEMSAVIAKSLQSRIHSLPAISEDIIAHYRRIKLKGKALPVLLTILSTEQLFQFIKHRLDECKITRATVEASRMNDDHGLNSLVLLLSLADSGRNLSETLKTLQPDGILSILAFCSDETVALLRPHQKIVELKLGWRRLHLGIRIARNGSHNGSNWEYTVEEKTTLTRIREMLRKKEWVSLRVKFDGIRSMRGTWVAWKGYALGESL